MKELLNAIKNLMDHIFDFYLYNPIGRTILIIFLVLFILSILFFPLFLQIGKKAKEGEHKT